MVHRYLADVNSGIYSQTLDQKCIIVRFSLMEKWRRKAFGCVHFGQANSTRTADCELMYGLDYDNFRTKEHYQYTASFNYLIPLVEQSHIPGFFTGEVQGGKQGG